MSNLSFGVNANNDIFLGSDGNLALVTGVTAVEQDCQHAIQAQLGEMIFNPTGGMPTFDDVWQAKNFIKWEAVARATLAAISGVFRVVSFTVAVNASNFTYVAIIQTVYSPFLSTISGTVGL